MRARSSFLMIVAMVVALAVPVSSALGADSRGSRDVRILPVSAYPGSYGEELTPAARESIKRGYLVPDGAALVRAKAAAEARAGQLSNGANPSAPRTATIFRSWEGLFDTQVTPSDSTGAIGPDRYVELVNSRYGIYSRTSDIPLSAGPIGDLVGVTGGILTDPQVIWDPDTDRFYYVELEVSQALLLIGFSTTSSPSTAGDWCKYFADFTNLPDYPKLGDTQDFLLIGENTFSPVGNFISSDVFWLTKPLPGSTCPPGSSFLAGLEIDLRHPDGAPAFTPVPANQIDGSGTGWVVAAEHPAFGTPDALSVFSVTKNPDGTANIAGTATTVPVTPFFVPPNAPQPGTGALLDTLDTRVTQAVSAFDPLRGTVAIWTQHTVAGGAGSDVQWYEIDPVSGSVLQSGTATSNSLYAFNGAISPDRLMDGTTTAFGDSMALGFNTSSSSAFPAIQMVSKIGSSSQTAFTLVKQSAGPNVDFSCFSPDGPPCRWGDYAAATPDPAVSATKRHGQVWLTSMWNTTGASGSDLDWRTWNWAVALTDPVTIPPPPTITSFSPTNGPVGTSVTISGTNFISEATSVKFFDNVSATAVTVDSSTQITTTVPSGASTGPISVTTPGGIATSTDSFTVTVPPPPPPPPLPPPPPPPPAPTISSFTLTSGPVGTSVMIAGTNFTGTTSVKFGGVASTSFTVNSSTQITAVVPAGAVTGPISVVAPSGTAVSSTDFTVLPTFHDRSLSLALRKHLVARGTVTVSDGFAGCRQNVPVRIQRKVAGDWRTIASTFTDSTGLFREPIPDRAGTYRAVAPKAVLTNDVCRRAVSPVMVNA